MSGSDTAHEIHERHPARLLELLTRPSYEQREVTLSSGLKSNFYIECKQTVLGAEGHFLVGSLFRREEGGREALEREAPLVTLFRRRDFV
jgi:hypothetical protein